MSKHLLFILRTLPYPIERDGLTLINYRLLKYAPCDYFFDIISLSNETDLCFEEVHRINPNIKSIYVIPEPALDNNKKRFIKLIINCIYSNRTSYDLFLKEKSTEYDMVYTCLPPSALFLTTQNYNVPFFVNAVDSFSMLNLRFFKYSKNLISYIKYLLYLSAERRCFQKPNLVNFVSNVDRNFTDNFFSRRGLIVIPNGVEHSVSKDELYDKTPKTLLFVGNFKNISNVLSVNYFCNEIYPILKKKDAELKLFIVGPHANFDFKDKSIVVTGFVNDLQLYYHRCSIFIAPLVTGSGIKNKVLEAMAAGIPVITTNIGIDGIDVKNREHVMVANTAIEWTNVINELLQDERLCLTLSTNARHYIEANYDWRIVVRQYYSYFQSIIK